LDFGFWIGRLLEVEDGFFDFSKDKTLKTELEIQHPKLGRLVYEEEGYWTGRASFGEYKIEFSIDGNETGIDAGLDEICVEALNHFFEFNKKALALLRQTVSDYGIPVPLEFAPFEIIWIWKEENKEGFTIRFNDNQDPYKLWRVEFENGEPINCGYDD
jgi:hypothetical protein